LSEEEIEGFGLSAAIIQGRTGEFLDTDVFLNELRHGSKD
jgi:hypothetical protein